MGSFLFHGLIEISVACPQSTFRLAGRVSFHLEIMNGGPANPFPPRLRAKSSRLAMPNRNIPQRDRHLADPRVKLYRKRAARPQLLRLRRLCRHRRGPWSDHETP